mgnify:CR=1 FL=1
MSSLNQNVIRHKIGLLNLATELGNVSRACKLMGLSRDTFYRYQNAMADGGVEALFDANRRRPNPKNRVEDATEAAVLAYTTEQPAHGQTRASNELRQRGIFVSPSGVRSIWLRHDLASFIEGGVEIALNLLELVPAEIVAAAFHVADRELASEGLLQERQIPEKQLFLKILRRRGDYDSLV